MSYDLISVIPDRVSTSHDQPRPPEAQHCALERHKQESEGTKLRERFSKKSWLNSINSRTEHSFIITLCPKIWLKF